MATTSNEQQMRDGVIKRIREELRKVYESLETYVPEAVILEGSSLTIRIALSEITTVQCDFEHMA